MSQSVSGQSVSQSVSQSCYPKLLLLLLLEYSSSVTTATTSTSTARLDEITGYSDDDVCGLCGRLVNLLDGECLRDHDLGWL